MNINNWSGKKKVWAIILGIFAIIGIIITIFLVQKVQEIRLRAEKATILSLAPTNQNVNAGEEGELEVVVNPGVNQVNFIKTLIEFDSEKFELEADSFKLNSELKWSFIEDPTVEDGNLSFVIGVGTDATRVIKDSPQKIGKISFKVKDDAEDGESEFSFDEEKTQIRSVGGGDPFTENVLSSSVPATVTIGAPICKPNIATCSWEASEGNIEFHYKITDTEDDSVVLEGNTDKTKIEFPSKPGKTYKCEVTSINECGEADPSSGTSKCPIPTPSPTLSPSPTPSPSPTVTPTPTRRPTQSPTPTPTPTEGPGPTEEPTATPTNIVVSTPTPTTAQGGGETTTPAPSLPPTGNPLVITGLIGGFLFLLGGLALLFL